MQTDFIDLRGICQFCLSRIYTRQHAIFYKGDILKLRPLNFANYWRPLIVCFKGRYGINREGSPICLTNQICIPQVSVSPTPLLWEEVLWAYLMSIPGLFFFILWSTLTNVDIFSTTTNLNFRYSDLATKIRPIFHFLFDTTYLVASNYKKKMCQILWPSQKVWNLPCLVNIV